MVGSRLVALTAASKEEPQSKQWAVVVAQLAERSLPTPEIRGSNPDIGNISNIFICQLLSRKDENKDKEAGNGPFKKNQKTIGLNEAAWFRTGCSKWAKGCCQTWQHGKKIERHKIEATRIIPTYPSQVEVDLDIGHVFEPLSLKIEKH